jgi:hypothetical protein
MEWDRYYDVAMEALYMDRLGDPDIGLKRGGPLKLSQDAFDREIERLLSHAWADQAI